jgi:hypothetical protein
MPQSFIIDLHKLIQTKKQMFQFFQQNVAINKKQKNCVEIGFILFSRGSVLSQHESEAIFFKNE